MKKVLVFGSTGMAGHMVTMYLSNIKDKYNVSNVCHRNKLNKNSIVCDISDINHVNEIIQIIDPDVIINCIGVLNKVAELNIKNTVYVNTFFPKFLARIGEMKNIKIIHLSTDCVFSGSKGSYNEQSFKDEEGIYGLSKNLGEIEDKNCLTIRTSIIGPELKNGSGLFNWFMSQKGTIKGFSSVFWSGITTLELSKAIDKALDTNIEGIYNITPGYKISKYDLLNIIKDEFKKDDIIIEKNNTIVCDKSLVTIKKDFDYKAPSYEEMVKEMKTWMQENRDLYKIYN
ncbi:MAG: dTDP-4-dehydrorhamnose reductase family protein [Paraclostridium dentum]|uniref:dTDP-4-dehydrorhamnose reductase n=1 Tax=Paraclostridium bifermentans TaxID=1490 RepID=A0A5P3X836_PARBF|nr:SDR family oxidoreductase [Paraclostridium bifermentans]QEZ67478.1 SDR family oxidoreductase [Paraclostridium bifermentans]